VRKLASIQAIASLLPIPGADKIEVAQIGGWNVVVKKGEFSVGDLGVYFEIDSFLPGAHPAFEFLAKDAKERDGVMRIRLKTIRLRKQLSQGLILPISAFPELSKSVLGLRVLTEGDDVSELLNVEKYEPPEERAANGGPADQRSRTSQWPFFIQKTDQERVQNAVPQIERAAASGESFEVSTKLDGSSMTVYALRHDSPHFAEAFKKRAAQYEAAYLKKLTLWQAAKYWFGRAFGKPAITPLAIFGVCSRNIELDLDGNTHFAQYVRDHDVIAKIEALCLNEGSLAFQGELIAPTIQGNYEKVEKPEWYVYDVYKIDDQQYALPYMARAYTAAAGLDYVPTASLNFKLWQEGEPADGRSIMDKMLAAAEGPGMNPGVKREGQVYKSNTTPFSVKCISNSYLEQKG
jgi:RNA ligase (TIGR02306 family)